MINTVDFSNQSLGYSNSLLCEWEDVGGAYITSCGDTFEIIGIDVDRMNDESGVAGENKDYCPTCDKQIKFLGE